MHNLVLCIRAGALLGLGLVIATPVCRRLVCCTPLSTPLSHRTFLSPPLFSLPSRPPKHRKGEERREREKAAGFKNAAAIRSQDSPDTPLVPSSSVAPIWSSRDGDGLRISAQGLRQQLRRPCRVSQGSALPGTVFSLPAPPPSFSSLYPVVRTFVWSMNPDALDVRPALLK